MPSLHPRRGQIEMVAMGDIGVMLFSLAEERPQKSACMFYFLPKFGAFNELYVIL